ncbi:hypothetical protein TNCV_2016991 [Trichonephila clavipes]|nr:hypothetical protein TNCV_2016991 [Trichonephila clavipes]
MTQGTEELHWLEFQAAFIWNNFLSTIAKSCLEAVVKGHGRELVDGVASVEIWFRVMVLLKTGRFKERFSLHHSSFKVFTLTGWGYLGSEVLGQVSSSSHSHASKS